MDSMNTLEQEKALCLRKALIAQLASAYRHGLLTYPKPLGILYPRWRLLACVLMARCSMSTTYRIAFASNSLSGLLAITRSGQAISVITRSAAPRDLFVLDGLVPPLPDIGISLAYAAPQPSVIVKTFGSFVESRLAGQDDPLRPLG